MRRLNKLSLVHCLSKGALTIASAGWLVRTAIMQLHSYSFLQSFMLFSSIIHTLFFNLGVKL
jgi:hypothetical protein